MVSTSRRVKTPSLQENESKSGFCSNTINEGLQKVGGRADQWCHIETEFTGLKRAQKLLRRGVSLFPSLTLSDPITTNPIMNRTTVTSLLELQNSSELLQAKLPPLSPQGRRMQQNFRRQLQKIPPLSLSQSSSLAGTPISISVSLPKAQILISDIASKGRVVLKETTLAHFCRLPPHNS